MAEAAAFAMPLLTEDDRALLAAWLPDDAAEPDVPSDVFYPAPAGYRERLSLGDLSW